jgi:NADPH-dependent 2,4-dienoyl-CoA reductase/sulfur reductase-like enzyme/pSer/pThr/pTyr-binding forkhead associated (FHA) protein
MAERASYVVIGNGIAGTTAAEILREEDSAADVTVVADDPFPAYYRPALKDYLGGKVREDKLWARPINFYADRKIRFLTDRVVGIQPGQHTVQLRSGQSPGYSRLLLAHGARASTLNCPGINLAGVTTLRTVSDYQMALSRLNMIKRVVVVGSGTLALETIETLRHRGFQVTHLIRGRSLWSEVLDPTASDLVLQQERRDGVDARLGEEIGEIIGVNGQVTGVITKTGASIPCEMVLLGIGIDPIIDFTKSAGIACGRGVKVDGMMRTNASDIYAAGDLIETTDPISGRSRVIGQWFPCIQQARAAAYSMLDLLDTKTPLRFGNFYNATFLYGLDFASVGISSIPKGGKGYQELVADPQPRTYQKVILKNGVPVGALALGDRKGVLALKRAIDHNVNMQPIASRLFAPDFDLSAWLDKQGVPPPILGVSREGAVAVKQAVETTGEARLQAVLQAMQKMTEAVLVPVASPNALPSLKETYLSQTKVTLLGRLEGATIPINHGSISRRHAEISFVNGQYVLRDLGSTNGTFVHDTRLEPNSVHILKNKDTLRFGNTSDIAFVFQLRQADAGSSILLKQQKAASPSDKPTAYASPGNDNGEDGTMRVKQGAVTPSLTGQPIFNADGTVLLPGASEAIPATMVANLQKAPALVALMQGKPVVFILKRGRRFTIGRTPENDIVLNDMSISRKHAEVSPGPDGLYIRDLGSSNGVSVNQTHLDNPYRLSSSDRIMVGNVLVYFLELGTRQSDLAPIVAQHPATRAGEGKPRPYEEQGGTPGTPGAHPVAGGANAAVQSKYCRNCGAKNDSVVRFCPTCGAPM